MSGLILSGLIELSDDSFHCSVFNAEGKCVSVRVKGCAVPVILDNRINRALTPYDNRLVEAYETAGRELYGQEVEMIVSEVNEGLLLAKALKAA